MCSIKPDNYIACSVILSGVEEGVSCKFRTRLGGGGGHVNSALDLGGHVYSVQSSPPFYTPPPQHSLTACRMTSAGFSISIIYLFSAGWPNFFFSSGRNNYFSIQDAIKLSGAISETTIKS